MPRLWQGTLCVTALLISAASDARGPIPHEHFDPNPEEDLLLGATTASGVMPAAVLTRSGVVSAPDPSRDLAGGAALYGSSLLQNSVEARFRLDRLTGRPDVVDYDSPFRPSLLPFKRMFAFDSVDLSWSLSVRDQNLVPVALGGVAEAHEDVFFADLEVKLTAGAPVRIPTIGPGARIRALQLEPPRPVEVLRDGADNWFVRASASGTARLLMQLSIDRRTFGDVYPPIGWSVLAGKVPQLPPEVQKAALRISQEIGALDAPTPGHAVRLLVDYFRRFRDSDELPLATNPRELYLELSIDQKGVCRHRAYAFLVTALSLGIPTRLVHNEAHAWVEVFGADLWHRIDLGGAAARVEEPPRAGDTPRHRPPPDPFSWPGGGQPASALADAAATQRERHSGSSSTPGPGQGEPPETNPGVEEPSAADPRGSPGGRLGRALNRLIERTSPAQDRRAPEISLQVDAGEVRRGEPLKVTGRATVGGKPCALSRLDLFLVSEGRPVPIGSVATDRDGYFLGQVTIPRDTDVGRQAMTVRVGAGCPNEATP